MGNKKTLIICFIIALIVTLIIGIIAINGKKTKVYNVSFETDGGTLVNSQTVNEGEQVKKPSDPIKEGYIFIEWICDGEIYDFSVEVTSDLILTAKYVKKQEDIETFVIKFDSDGGTTISNQIIEKGKKVQKPTAPIKEGYTFKVWTLNDEEYNFDLVVEKNIELKAKWEKVIESSTNNNQNNTQNSNQNNNNNNSNITQKVETPTLTAGGGAQGVAILEITREGAYKEEWKRNSISGWELYEKEGTEYKLVKSEEVFYAIEVTADIGESKTYVARAYALNKNNQKIYSGYSNEYKLDNSKVETPTLTAGGGAQGVALLEITREGAYKEEWKRNIISGWELYEKEGTEYKLVKSQEVFNTIEVTADIGESKTYVARAYALNKNNQKIYSGYSNEYILN